MPRWMQKIKMLNWYTVYAYLCESHGEYFWKEGSHCPFISCIHNAFMGKSHQWVSLSYLNFEESKITTSDRQVKIEAFKLDKVKSHKGKINSRLWGYVVGS